MKKSKYDISVIIPCYNCDKYISYSINSIMNQKYDINKIEIILINDGSTDNTLSILKKYERDNIVVIDKINEGVSATRNLGMKKAQGKYILFLDADDLISNNAIAKIVSFFDENYKDIDVIAYPIKFYSKKGKTRLHSRYKKERYNKGTAIYDLNEYYYLVQPTINVAIKNDGKYLFDVNQSYSEDEKFITPIIMQKQKMGYIEDIFYLYRVHNKSVTANKKNKDFEKIYEYYDKFLNDFNDHPYIQSIIMNNLRWRLDEDCLYPNDLDIKQINKYLEKLINRVNRIDFSLFMNNQIKLKKDEFEFILSLTNKKLTLEEDSDKFKLIYNDIKYNISVMNYIYNIVFENKKLKIYGKINTLLWKENPIKLYAEYKGRKYEIDLECNYDYLKDYSYNYILNLDYDIGEKIKLTLMYKNEEILFSTKGIENIIDNKIINKNIVCIDKNSLVIRKANIRKIVSNKYLYKYPIPFAIINFLSFFVKKKDLYFVSKNIDLYNEYLETNNNKILFESSQGLKYKLNILRAKKVITDKNFKEVYPFGTMTKYYIKSSSSEFICRR